MDISAVQISVAYTSGSVTAGKVFEATVNWPLELRVFASSYVLWAIVLAAFGVVVWRLCKHLPLYQSLQIDQAELGIGGSKIKLTPNWIDRQIAYKIWVELSTRKIGLPIDLDHDVIVEVYDSWHTFFQVTRELIKDVPVSKFRRHDTEQIVRISIGVLNDGLRPHLTTWQARFRRWYDYELNAESAVGLAPQEIQRAFGKYTELSEDLIRVNGRLMAYRKLMYELITGQQNNSESSRVKKGQ